MDTDIQEKTDTRLSNGPGFTRLRHILETGPDKKPIGDKCLCGYVWDVFPIRHDPYSGICEECVAEHKRRNGG